jgi:aminoglycoside 6'-N-acetyltransferase I
LEVRQLSDAADADWLEMRGLLWDRADEAENAAHLIRVVAEPSRFAAFLAVSAEGRGVGFAEVSVRTDYVNGSKTSPVAFLEGIYVRAEFRRRGVARLLCEAAQRWGRARGCTELASDAGIDNTVSHGMHTGLGFEETERVVYFRKDL